MFQLTLTGAAGSDVSICNMKKTAHFFLGGNPAFGQGRFLSVYAVLAMCASALVAQESGQFGTLIKGDGGSAEVIPATLQPEPAVDQQPAAPEHQVSQNPSETSGTRPPPQRKPRGRARPRAHPVVQQSVPQVTSPESTVNQVLSKHPVDAGELLETVEKYPAVVVNKLRSQPIEIRGVVERIQILGMDNDRVEVTLQGKGPIHVILCDNIRSRSGGFVDKPSDCKNEWISERSTLEMSSVHRDGSKETSPILTENRPFSANVMISSVSPASLKFEVVR